MIKTNLMLGLIFIGTQCFAVDKLLPAAEFKLTNIEFTQDGKAITISIRNGGGMTITSGILECIEESIVNNNCKGLFDIEAALRAPINGKKVAPANLVNCYAKPSRVNKFPFEKKIPPGKSASIYMELHENIRISRCSGDDFRGRNKSVMDNFN
jgi:hypothetical protein